MPYDISWIERVKFSPDGTRLAISLEDNSAGIFDAAGGRELTRLRGHEGDVYGVSSARMEGGWSQHPTIRRRVCGTP